jgi:hypothetical protein
MTTVHGNEGKVTVGSDELKVRSFNLTIRAPVSNDTAIGDAWDVNIAGAPKSWSGSLTATYKKGTAAAQTALVPGASVTLSLYAAGDGAGEDYYTGTALVEERSFSHSITDPVEVTFSFVGTGALAEETVGA